MKKTIIIIRRKIKCIRYILDANKKHNIHVYVTLIICYVRTGLDSSRQRERERESERMKEIDNRNKIKVKVKFN